MTSSRLPKTGTLARSSSSGWTRSGTITGVKPPAIAARIPAGLSSRTQASPGSTPSPSAAARKISGAGFEGNPWSPVQIALKKRLMPACSRTASTDGLAVEDATGSIIKFASDKLGLKVSSIHKSVRAAMPTTEERARLQISFGQPLLEMERVAFLADGRPYEYALTRYRGDKFEYQAIDNL